MPQKKNPDIAELIRGQAGPVMGHFVGLHELIKSLPLTYNRDLQEDKRQCFRPMDITRLVLECMKKMLAEITVNTDAVQRALNTGHILATELADYLVSKGMPFREAHEVVGELVNYAESKQQQVHELSVSELQSQCALIESDVSDWLTFESAINRKDLIGGTAFNQVADRIQHCREPIG